MAEDAEPGLALLVALAAEMLLVDVLRGLLRRAEGRHGGIRLGGGVDVAAQGVDGAEREGRFGDALGENVEAARAARVEREAAAELGVLVEDWRVREREEVKRVPSSRCWERMASVMVMSLGRRR